jgi:aspartate racemase
MKTIGLIGGMSFESTAVYYTRLNQATRRHFGGLASAEILLHSVNFADIVALQQAGQWVQAGEKLAGIAQNLETAGADCVLICTNTMHKVAAEVQAALTVPVIDIIDETASVLRAAGKTRPLLLATRYTMEDGFYHKAMARAAIDVIVPEEPGRSRVHDIIFTELCAGQVLDDSRRQLLDIVAQAKTAGADSVILGCTEICMILDPAHMPLPGFDSTAIHCDAASRFAFTQKSSLETERKYA